MLYFFFLNLLFTQIAMIFTWLHVSFAAILYMPWVPRVFVVTAISLKSCILAGKYSKGTAGPTMGSVVKSSMPLLDFKYKLQCVVWPFIE